MDLWNNEGGISAPAKAIKDGDEGEVVKLLEKNPALANGNLRGHVPLGVASAYGQLGVVRLLAQRGARVNEVTRRDGRTALHWAVEGGHQEVASFLLSKDARADYSDYDSQTPLLLACEGGHAEIVRMLVDHLGGQGTDMGVQAATIALRWAARVGHAQMTRLMLSKGAQNTGDNRGRTPLIEACSNGHLGVVPILVEHVGRNGLETKDNEGHTALYYAAHSGHEEIVALLLRKRAQANGRGASSATNLIGASSNGHLGIVKMLVHHMGDEGLEDTDMGGHTALYHAARQSHEKIVDFLLSKGAQASSRNEFRMTVVMGASVGGHLGVVQRLVQHMGEEGLEDTDDYGHTALYHAAGEGHEEVVAFLLSKGVQASSTDTEGRTVLMRASMSGFLGVVQLLVQHMGKEGLEAKDGRGDTALSHAARGGHEKVVTFLLGKGVQANDRDAEGRTALMKASRNNHLGMVRVLVQHTGGEGLNERDVSGRTALHGAAKEHHGGMVRLLLVSGADPSITDNQGRTPHALAMQSGHVGFMRSHRYVEEQKQAVRAVFQWWECELERRRVLYRATSLHKVYTTQRDQSTSQVPTYLKARVAAGHALPLVEAMVTESQQTARNMAYTAGTSYKRKVAHESGDQQEAEVDDEEVHALLQYVLEALNEELSTELLEGFH